MSNHPHNTNFYPRSPCGERRFARPLRATKYKFLSTLSLRRATLYYLCLSFFGFYFYPRSPCGERPRAASCQQRSHQISIHALLAESDFGQISVGFIGGLFLSTLSLRRATGNKCCKGSNDSNFYPRSPCGERRVVSVQVRGDVYFYPRSPCGERQ